MKAPPLLAHLCVLLALTAAGCQNAREDRIREHAATYARLDRFSQQLVRQGLVNYGFTADMVYLSLGKPNRVTTTEESEGPVTTWTYQNYLYQSSAAVRVGVSNPGTRPLGTVLSSSAPGGPSLNSTKAGPGAAAIDEDSSLCTLYILLQDDRVVGIRIKP